MGDGVSEEQKYLGEWFHMAKLEIIDMYIFVAVKK
jgi:hypothetical protein